MAITINGSGTITGISAGGLPANSISVEALGVGQTQQNVTASRAINVTYTNSTGKPIIVFVLMSFGDLTLLLDGVVVWFFTNGSSARAQMIVPNGSTYSLSAAAGRTFSNWTEYR